MLNGKLLSELVARLGEYNIAIQMGILIELLEIFCIKQAYILFPYKCLNLTMTFKVSGQ